MVPQVIVLEFANTPEGQREKAQHLAARMGRGWVVVSESVEQGHVDGQQACCLGLSGMLCCGLFGAPAMAAAGRTTGITRVTMRRDAKPP